MPNDHGMQKHQHGRLAAWEHSSTLSLLGAPLEWVCGEKAGQARALMAERALSSALASTPSAASSAECSSGANSSAHATLRTNDFRLCHCPRQ